MCSCTKNKSLQVPLHVIFSHMGLASSGNRQFSSSCPLPPHLNFLKSSAWEMHGINDDIVPSVHAFTPLGLFLDIAAF